MEPTFYKCLHQTVVINKRQTNPTRLGLPCSSCSCERLNNSSTLFWHALLQVLHPTPDPEKNWQLNEIIHFLVWCHPKIAIIAEAWRLWSLTGRDTSSGRGALRVGQTGGGSRMELLTLCSYAVSWKGPLSSVCCKIPFSVPLTFYWSHKTRQG